MENKELLEEFNIMAVKNNEGVEKLLISSEDVLKTGQIQMVDKDLLDNSDSYFDKNEQVLYLDPILLFDAKDESVRMMCKMLVYINTITENTTVLNLEDIGSKFNGRIDNYFIHVSKLVDLYDSYDDFINEFKRK